MEAIDILRGARAKIADPKNWGKGRRHVNRPHETCCIAEAIEECAKSGTPERLQAIRAFYNAAGLDLGSNSLTHWNDVPERTHAEIMVTLNLAIATLRL